MHVKNVQNMGPTAWARHHGLQISATKVQWRKGWSPLGKKASVGSSHPLYSIYRGILTRCYNVNSKPYKDYGGRGIRVCARWFYSFDAFVADMGERPAHTSIDRIDNDGDYCPENCTWSTRKIQNINRQCNFNEMTCIRPWRKKWRVQVSINGKKLHGGMYATLSDAQVARDELYNQREKLYKENPNGEGL